MTQLERDQILQLLALLSEQSPQPATRTRILFTIEQLTAHPIAKILPALKRLAIHSRTFPTVGEILAEMGIRKETEVQNPAEDAVAIAGRISTAISKFGAWGPRDARQYIGEVGWEVVNMSCGWDQVCKVSDDELGMMTAQWREKAKAILSRGSRPLPGLPPPPTDRGLRLVKELSEGRFPSDIANDS